ncbi:hypothetical protein OIU78_000726 [Salix suchowensis]|nr:hypothetical protein OIU78_000726 [Salix suchowensis]
MQQAKKIDEEILQEVVKMGFDRNQIIESLRNRMQNEATVAYYLLLDNRFRVSNGYLGAEFQETMECAFNGTHPNESSSPAGGHHLPGLMDYQGNGLISQFPAERKWALGLQSRAPPREIMIEVLHALQELNVSWKKIGQYNMKCRWIPVIPGPHDGMVNDPGHTNHIFGGEPAIIENDGVTNSPNVVKFEVQLYKTRDEKVPARLAKSTWPAVHLLGSLCSFTCSAPGSLGRLLRGPLPVDLFVKHVNRISLVMYITYPPELVFTLNFPYGFMWVVAV